jgi:hypothetical protein
MLSWKTSLPKFDDTPLMFQRSIQMSSFIPYAVLAGSGLYVGKQITDYVHERDDAVLRIKCMPQNESVSVVKFDGARVLVGFESLWWGCSWIRTAVHFTPV